MITDEQWMKIAIDEAHLAMDVNEIPVGAVLVKENKLIAQAHNRPIINSDPTAHAEIEVLRKAGKKLMNYRLPKTTLYVTLEPCQMCAGALYWSRISNLFYASSDLKRGFTIMGSTLHPKTKVNSGILENESKELLERFFISRRNLN